ncbi:MAG: ATP phosphoribosyltransferase regulatory subunit [Fervidobacterium sp.]|nr:ATP phosphoribosyltransferase regulatory subunit [Fervidobacterium sp.]
MIDTIFRAFYKRVSENFEKFTQPDIKRVKDLKELVSGVTFMVKSGEIFKLRKDFTKFICEHVKALENVENQRQPHRFWYDGHVYFFDNFGNLKSRYEIGLEIIPGGIYELLECIKIIVGTYTEYSNSDLILELSDARVLEDLIKDVSEDIKTEILEMLDKKDFSELEVLGSVRKIDVSKLVEVVKNSFSKRRLEDWQDFPIKEPYRKELETVIRSLEGFENVVVEVDFSLARTTEEYCGLTFALFDTKSSKLVAAGGEYKVNEFLHGVGGTIFLSEIRY